MDSFEDIIARAAASSEVNREDAHALCKQASITVDDLWNRLALAIAQRFEAGTMSFEDADAAMNAIHVQMLEDFARIGSEYDFPEPAYAIFLAFDAGEFYREDWADPVEKYTRPALAKILREA